MSTSTSKTHVTVGSTLFPRCVLQGECCSTAINSAHLLTMDVCCLYCLHQALAMSCFRKEGYEFSGANRPSMFHQRKSFHSLLYPFARTKSYLGTLRFRPIPCATVSVCLDHLTSRPSRFTSFLLDNYMYLRIPAY